MLNALKSKPTFFIRQCVVAAAAVFACLPGAQAKVLDDSGWVTSEVVEIYRTVAHAHGLPAPTEHRGYGALDNLHDFGSHFIRRPAGSERLGLAAIQSYRHLAAPLKPNQRQKLAALFEAMGDVGAVEPPAAAYDYIFIHGTTVPEMRRRLAAVASVVDRGAIEMGPGAQVIFFDGERPLFAKETADVLLNPYPYQRDPAYTPPLQPPTDEREAAEMVYRQLWLPAQMRAMPAQFVHAPAERGQSRAHTQGVVHHWLETGHPKAGRALMVSTNPFVEYQRLATLLAFREGNAPAITLDAMGPADEFEDELSDVALGIRLDNLAASVALALKLRTLEDQGIQPGLLP